MGSFAGQKFEPEEWENYLSDRDLIYDEKDCLVYTNEEEVKKQSKVLSYLIKRMGVNILKGKSIMNVSLPVAIFEKLSLL